MNFRGSDRRGDDFGIDLMPLIDVVFLLLIFFLITTSFTRPREERQINVNLPSGITGSEASADEPVTIVVTSDGEVKFEGDAPEGETLVDKLKALKEERPDASIMLRGDTEASHGKVVETLDAIKASDFDKVNLIIKKRPDEGP